MVAAKERNFRTNKNGGFYETNKRARDSLRGG